MLRSLILHWASTKTVCRTLYKDLLGADAQPCDAHTEPSSETLYFVLQPPRKNKFSKTPGRSTQLKCPLIKSATCFYLAPKSV